MQRSFIRKILESIDDETISFAGGLPDEKLFPAKQLKKAANKVLKDKSIYQYTLSNGISELREKIAKQYTNDGFPTKADEIMITTGSQQATYIIAKYFQNKKITLEKPSYLGAINIFKLNNLKLDSINLEKNAIECKSFKKSFSNTKLAYLIPDFQNPTTNTYDDKTRNKIAKIVQKHNGFIIEDSPYTQLYFVKKSQSISSQVPNNSFHLGSFSKVLSPSLRVGWIRASKELLDELLVIKESIDLHTCGISQHILNEYLKDEKQYKKHLLILRKSYKDKMNYFCKCLDKYLPSFHYSKPKGGMFIYGSFKNIDTYKLVQKTMKEKVIFVPGNQFYEDKNCINSEIRFNFSNSNFGQIKKGIKKINKFL